MTDRSSTLRIEAAPELVHLAFVNDTHLCEWLCYDADIGTRSGGPALIRHNDPAFLYAGTITELEPGHLVAFDLRRLDGDGRLRLRAETGPDGGGTRLELALAAADGDPLAALIETRLRNLVSVLETGYDLRVAELPLIGVMPGPTLDADALRERGLEQESGLAILGALAGFSAARSGFRADDVLLEADGQKLGSWTDFQRIVRDREVGQELRIRYGRDGAVHETELTLLPRPMPELPGSAAAAAAAVRARKRELERELDALFAGVTEAEASTRPSPQAWSANEVIAHLIATERDHQALIASLLISNELEVFSGNHPARVAATLARYPTGSALRAALAAGHEETVQMFAHLSDDELARKGSVIRCLMIDEGLAYHTRRHFGQIRRALAAAGSAVTA